jgi:hypothetical protein
MNKKNDFKTWDEMKESLFKRDPWYIELYYFFRYRLWSNLRDKRTRFFGFFERGRKGYAQYDLWCFDNYLCMVIGNGVKELAEKSIGWHNGDFNTPEEYTVMLNKMADGFLNFHKKELILGGTNEDDVKGLNESLELFKKYFNCLWD